jgi:prepilin-type N-terminal cleavage/methylation domain-containing protein
MFLALKITRSRADGSMRAMKVDARHPGASSPFKAEDGFTIIEVLVTAVIIAIVMGATYGALASAGRAGSEQRRHAESYAVAQKDQARMRSLRISQLNGLDEVTVVNEGGTEYEVHSTGEFVNDVTGTASCEEGTNSSDYIKITSTVTWPSIGNRPATVIQSLVAPPAGSLSEDTGALAVVVRDGAGNGLAGVPLTGSGAGSFSGQTGDTGCVLFTDLPVGNYTLTPSTAAGVVDADGNPPGPIDTSVVGQSTNTLVLRYDTPGRINVDFRTRISGSVQSTTADGVVVFNTGMTAPKPFAQIGSPVSSIDVGPLFPFSSPYAVYAGSCEANNPNPDELEDPPAAAALADVSVLPSQTATATIQLPALDLTVRNGNSSSPGAAISGATVKVADNGCQQGGNPVTRTYTTNASGKLSNPGLPYGTYDVCASAFLSGSNRRNTIDDLAVETTDTDTVATIYLGSGSGRVTGTCP